MHDLREIRNNPEQFLEGMSRREPDFNLDELLEMDQKKREITQKLDEMRQMRNSVSKQIGQKRKAKEESSDLETEMRQLGKDMKAGEEEERELDQNLRQLLLSWPNIPSDLTPIGKSEADNVVKRNWGEIPTFDFELNDHLDVANRLGMLDFTRGGKIAGSGFPLWRNAGALLERALINFMLDVQTVEHGYTEMLTPLMANRDSMLGSGQIPKLEDDMYLCEKEDLFLIPTAEVTLVNQYRGEILNEEDLPLKFAAYSPCFRREGGAYGSTTRGFLRTHQFNKVELVRFERPEEADEVWEEMIGHAEEILRRLELPYRILQLCSGDLTFNSKVCCDIEIWAPADGGKWVEASSISNCGEFQSRRAGIKYRPKGGGKARFPHILNGSGLATSRLLVALLETYQTEEGSLAIPPVLRPYMHGQTVVTATN
ncbi:MAG: serine--tRNA ligase [Calditrichaeota bacterium]|jgi:seryl-tRNA synthetase|nr:serine--tRNA ligase [Calditrichota bacterium]MBT7616566.1 serine--tRNA ligase [Calditrichota bacterium]